MSAVKTAKILIELAPEVIGLLKEMMVISKECIIETARINSEKDIAIKEKDIVIAKIDALVTAHNNILKYDFDVLKESNEPFILNIKAQCKELENIDNMCYAELHRLVTEPLSDRQRESVMDLIKFIMSKSEALRSSLNSITAKAGDTSLEKLNKLKEQHGAHIQAICSSYSKPIDG